MSEVRAVCMDMETGGPLDKKAEMRGWHAFSAETYPPLEDRLTIIAEMYGHQKRKIRTYSKIVAGEKLLVITYREKYSKTFRCEGYDPEEVREIDDLTLVRLLGKPGSSEDMFGMKSREWVDHNPGRKRFAYAHMEPGSPAEVLSSISGIRLSYAHDTEEGR
jgi:hypothetical protein